MIVPRKSASIICSPSHEVFQNTTLSGALTSNHGDLGQIYTRWLPNMSECILDFVHNGDKVFHTFIPHLRFGKKYTSPYVEAVTRWRCPQVSGSQFPLFYPRSHFENEVVLSLTSDHRTQRPRFYERLEKRG